MFARLCVPLDFRAVIRPDDTFEPVVVEREGYRFEVYPPYKSGLSPGDADFTAEVPAVEFIERLLPVEDPILRVRLDNRPAAVADAIYVDIYGEALDRSAGQGIGVDQEVVVPLALRMINKVLGRIGATTENSPVVNVSEDVPHVLIYLDDSGVEFDTDPSGQLVHRRVKAQFVLPAMLVLTPELWDAGRKLPPDFVNPAWEVLLSEARRLLPDIGPPLVLAYSSVEIRLDHAIEVLATRAGAGAPDLVRWIMERSRPSVSREASELLPLLGAESLSSDNQLWERFHRLRKARNTFVHDGIARIDRNLVTRYDIGHLISTARDVIDWIDGQLGYERPRFQGKAELNVGFPLTAIPPPANDNGADMDESAP